LPSLRPDSFIGIPQKYPTLIEGSGQAVSLANLNEP
jgi:hypothetical protein